jgi:hypothetical protein
MNEWLSKLRLPPELQTLIATFFDPSGRGLFTQFLERIAPGAGGLFDPVQREILGAAVFWALLNPTPQTASVIVALIQALRRGLVGFQQAVETIATTRPDTAGGGRSNPPYDETIPPPFVYRPQEEGVGRLL